MVQYFSIFIYSHNCLYCSDIFFTQITCITLLIDIVCNYNKLNIGFRFCDKNTKYSWTLLNNLALKLLLGHNLKIIITEYAIAIIAFFANIKASKSLK